MHLALRATLAAGLLAATASPSFAVTEIQWWHAMTGPNNDVVVKLAEDFNKSQSDYKVVPSYKGSYPDTLNAGGEERRRAVCGREQPTRLRPSW